MKTLLWVTILTGTSLLLANCTKKEMNKTTHSVDRVAVDNEVVNVVDKLYTSINYNGKKQPNWDLIKTLFLEEAEMIPVTDSSYTKMAVDDFINIYREQIETNLIKKATEYEIYQVGDQYQNIAQVFSTYKTETIVTDDTLSKRGINSIQLLKTENEWKIVSLIWFDETEKYSIPAQYLDD